MNLLDMLSSIKITKWPCAGEGNHVKWPHVQKVRLSADPAQVDAVNEGGNCKITSCIAFCDLN